MSPELKGYLLLAALKIIVVFTAYNLGVMLVIWAERRISGFIQDRLGPNRVGPEGLLQSVADGLKNILKEETIPGEADRVLFFLAPVLSFIPALILYAVIPFGAPLPIEFDGVLPWWTIVGPLLGHITIHGPVPMVIADIPIGLLFILAISSLGVYGIVLAGWSSGSKYSLLGGVRSSAQMISYEIALGMAVISVFLLAGNVTLSEVIAVQQESVWFVLALTLGFILFVIAAFAETNRLPFDLPEAEAELITGYHTEYSSMKFSMFFIAEYSNVITMSALMATLFFGGWDIPFTTWDEGEPSVAKWAATVVMFALKTGFFVFTYIWVRWTLPRFRFDQLMQLGWKVMLPVALGYIVLIATVVWLLDRAGVERGVGYGLILFAVNLALVAVFLWGLDRGRLLIGASRQRARVVS
ncbi:MAG: NADH-quinone oxidoreductase subunit H [Gemmatimonadales bacterium]|nr:NADH-quinone oxidoreductase subunit H [bacterium HR33]GIW51142.1 MAG: NADH-quinone oxidoreductase subunit H [Gemmatimonadales bacterium]